MMFDIIFVSIICVLLCAIIIMILAVTWAFFEDTELWEIIKDKIEGNDE